MKADTSDSKSSKLGIGRSIEVIFLSLYCAAAIVLPLLYVFLCFDQVFNKNGASAQHIFISMVLMGVLGSALRGVARLFTDVGKKKYQPSWSLSILMRPLEGAGIALVAYFATTAGIILVGQGEPTPSASGYLFIGVISGMFSHRAADALREHFDALWGRKPDKRRSKR